MTGRLDHDEMVGVTEGEATRVDAAARLMLSELGDSAEALAEGAAALATELPVSLMRVLHRFGNTGSAHNTLLVRGMLPPTTALGATPATTTPLVSGRAADGAGLTLLTVLGQLGQAFTFASLYEGRLVQQVVPVSGREDAQTSESSSTVPQWHVEDAFTELRCDFVGLLCLRGDPAATMLLAPARAVDLPAKMRRVLREPRFVVAPDVAHSAKTAISLPPGPVLSGAAEDPEICFDAVYQRPADPDDFEAAGALAILAAHSTTRRSSSCSNRAIW